MISAPVRILMVAGVCLAALIGLVVREGMARESGTEVILAMEAVDPRAMLTGHYVIVSLRERLDEGEACPDGLDTDSDFWAVAFEPFDRNAEWIALAEHGERHRAIATRPSRREAAEIAPLVARGRANCVAPVAAEGETAGGAGFINLDLGVTRFHVGQSEARRIEAILAEREPGVESRVSAIVSIGRDGRARLKGLLVEGERLELNWL